MFTIISERHKDLLMIFLFLFCFAETIKAQDLKPEEIIAKHLDSIGTSENRQSVKNRVAVGTSEFTVKVPYGTLVGKSLLASDELKNLIFISRFDSIDYPLEKIGLSSGKTKFSFIKPGVRSPLGSYLLVNDKILSKGLFGGSILPSWTLLKSGTADAKIENAGKKKINEQEVYILNYTPKSGFPADSSIKLYFDTKTFQHIRTEYRQNIGSKNFYPSGIFGAQTGETTNSLIEDFKDFKDVKGLLLPHSYKISLVLNGQAGTNEYQWNITISQYIVNQKLDNEFFSFNN